MRHRVDENPQIALNFASAGHEDTKKAHALFSRDPSLALMSLTLSPVMPRTARATPAAISSPRVAQPAKPVNSTRPPSERSIVLNCIDPSISYFRSIIRGFIIYNRTHKVFTVLGGGRNFTSADSILREADIKALIGSFASMAQQEEVRKSTLPAINISNREPDNSLPSVLSDDVAVGRLAAQHFLDKGFRNFGYLGFTGHQYSTERHRGFREELESQNRPVHYSEPPTIDISRWRLHMPDEAVDQWLLACPKPIAVFCAADDNARFLIDACLHLGISIPDEVAILGVNNDEMLCDLAEVPISSVELGGERIGYEAAALLHRILKGEPAPKEPILVKPNKIVSRHSTNILSVEDPKVAMAMRYIQENADRPISVTDVLKAVGMSRRALEKRFQKVAGRSPYAEILRNHIERAKELLIQTDMPIAEIAPLSGFSEARELSVMFKKKTGMTPQSFRQQYHMR